MLKHGKHGKAHWDPASYRTIGLESILLKMLTLLIDRRIREWADAMDLIPDTQNGFREGARTNNNAFVLRAAIEKARSEGKTLYVAFVDLTNAFPSVDQPTLWRKLSAMGVSGPLVDWLRMVYAEMRYIVRHEGQYSADYAATAGILTGDPASPILWDLFFADLDIADSPWDVELGGSEIGHARGRPSPKAAVPWQGRSALAWQGQLSKRTLNNSPSLLKMRFLRRKYVWDIGKLDSNLCM